MSTRCRSEEGGNILILIVGASGFIGGKLYAFLKKNKFDIRATYCTNDSNLLENEKIYLDLRNGDFSEIFKLNDLTHVILCHGISNIERCKIESDLSYTVNVTNTINLLKGLEKLDIVPVYFSTNMVYNGKTQNATELDNPDPTTEYGRQKLIVEQYIKNTFDKYIILRLTKVFGIERGDQTLFTGWLDKLVKNEKIYVANDIFISPVFIMDILKVTMNLMNGNHCGIYNFGGYKTMSSYNFSEKLAEFCGFDLSLIQKVANADFNFIEARPMYNIVDSTKVKITTNVDITSYEECFWVIFNNYGIVKNKAGA